MTNLFISQVALTYKWYEMSFCQTPLQLANPTQLQLVVVGVDFVFPLEEEDEEGRKEEK